MGDLTGDENGDVCKLRFALTFGLGKLLYQHLRSVFVETLYMQVEPVAVAEIRKAGSLITKGAHFTGLDSRIDLSRCTLRAAHAPRAFFRSGSRPRPACQTLYSTP